MSRSDLPHKLHRLFCSLRQWSATYKPLLSSMSRVQRRTTRILCAQLLLPISQKLWADRGHHYELRWAYFCIYEIRSRGLFECEKWPRHRSIGTRWSNNMQGVCALRRLAARSPFMLEFAGLRDQLGGCSMVNLRSPCLGCYYLYEYDRINWEWTVFCERRWKRS